MQYFKVFTDSTSDCEKEYRDEYGFDYLRMVFTQGGRDYVADLDWAEISPKDYYDAMKNGNRAITGLINGEGCSSKMEECFKAGYDFMYIACSSKLSNSVHTAEIIAEDLLKKYPERKAVCIDSLRSNYAEAMIAMRAADLAKKGLTIDETAKIIEDEKLKYQDWGTVGTLEFLRKAGRVKASAAFFGNLFGVKPMIVGDANGNNYAYKKVRGRKASLDELVGVICDRMEEPEKHILFLEHADCYEDVSYIAEEVKKRISPKKINISYMGPIIGAAIGPGAITVNFYGKKVDIAGEE
ncbi:MAG: DegV family protein [Clostridia bacterium]|nr:DegV family protein [Clostridia bacterium]